MTLPIYPGSERQEYVEATEPGACWHCGRWTYRIELNFQALLCSLECVDAKDREFWSTIFWDNLLIAYEQAMGIRAPDTGDW